MTILGHVQRGGSPSAFDRYLGTLLGYAAVTICWSHLTSEPQLVGIRGHHLVVAPLMECVSATRSIAGVIAAGDSATAMTMRGGSFSESYRTAADARPGATA